MYDLIDKFRDINELHGNEGERGLNNLEYLLKDFGYRDQGFLHGTVIEGFLSDNPGAIEAIWNWIGEQRVEEWEEALQIEEEEDAAELELQLVRLLLNENKPKSALVSLESAISLLKESR